jgi:hypothetical protein
VVIRRFQMSKKPLTVSTEKAQAALRREPDRKEMSECRVRKPRHQPSDGRPSSVANPTSRKRKISDAMTPATCLVMVRLEFARSTIAWYSLASSCARRSGGRPMRSETPFFTAPRSVDSGMFIARAIERPWPRTTMLAAARKSVAPLKPER